MIKGAVTLILLLSTYLHGWAQVLSMDELIKLHNADPDGANAYLLGLGWEFSTSKKDSAGTSVTWSFENGLANVNVTYYKEDRRVVGYGVQTPVTFLVIQSGIESAGFKKVGSSVEDDFIKTRYDSDEYVVIMNLGKLYAKHSNDAVALLLTLYLKEDLKQK